MFDEYLNPPPSVDLQVPVVNAPEPIISTGTPSSTTIDQDVPSTKADHDIEIAHMDNNPNVDFLIPEPTSEESSTQELVPRLDRVMITTLKWIYKVKLDEQGDVKTAFLNRIVRVEVYISQPDGFVDPENPNHVYKLKKAIYGLKQAPRTWYGLLLSFLLSHKFTKGTVDPTLLVRREGKEILLISQSPRGIFLNQSKYALESLKKYGMETYESADTPMVEKSKLDEDPQGKAVDPTRYHGLIGTLMYLTSSRPKLVFVVCMCARYSKDSCIALTAFIEADHASCQDTRKSTSGSMQLLGDRLQKKDGIFISQDKYVGEILKKFGFTKVKTTSTPMETQKPLLKDKDGEEVDVYMYRSMIGSLMYLTSSRPDIMFAVCACARYQVNPKVSHLHVVKRIFRYLKGQPKLGLWYPKDSPFDLVAYTDSDYAGASLDRKSTTRGCQFLGSRLISWQCKKQTVVANSTTKTEYISVLQVC
ncbi:retrovirus-related pol polyprotein from transposon TNT 1-94 [Tanacetum coccineum]|uniref:Retrovirus-related pol polyprotein from transposon TNT 1-94 n=1 Tax=Tanacetum coccineum TaxID=301880 RepID=A0ABQ5IJK5_9ASTR